MRPQSYTFAGDISVDVSTHVCTRPSRGLPRRQQSSWCLSHHRQPPLKTTPCISVPALP